MTELKWILPNKDVDEKTMRQFELESIRTRTEFKPSDLETEIGRINFFLFSPDRSMSANIAHEVFDKWSLDFMLVCQQGKFSEQVGLFTVFDLWSQAKKERKAMVYMPPLIAATVAGLQLNEKDFVELKRITIFLTKKPDGGLDLWVLKTPRHANTA